MPLEFLADNAIKFYLVLDVRLADSSLVLMLFLLIGCFCISDFSTPVPHSSLPSPLQVSADRWVGQTSSGSGWMGQVQKAKGP